MNSATRKTESIEEPGALAPLKEKLKSADPEIQHYVIALEKENLRLHKQIAKLQAENVSLHSRITVLEEQAKIPQANVSINF